MSKIQLRPVELKDCSLLWKWSNNLIARQASFNTQPILWSDHLKWFNAKLKDTSWHCYIILNETDLPIGVVRFDTAKNEAEVSISIDPNFRNQGYATKALYLASKQIFLDTQVTRISAHIKLENAHSIKAFTNAGYTKISTDKESLTLERNKG